jgi:hypothetical protein
MKRLFVTLTFMLISLTTAQTLYAGITTGTPIFNEDFKLGAQLGVNLTPEFEVRVAAEGNLADFQPQMGSLDAFYNFFLNVDRLTSGGNAVVGAPTNNALYLGGGIDGYYGRRARAINSAYRYGFHGVVGAEALLGRFGLFGEFQPGVVVRRNFTDLKASFRGKLGINFHF